MARVTHTIGVILSWDLPIIWQKKEIPGRRIQKIKTEFLKWVQRWKCLGAQKRGCALWKFWVTCCDKKLSAQDLHGENSGVFSLVISLTNHVSFSQEVPGNDFVSSSNIITMEKWVRAPAWHQRAWVGIMSPSPTSFLIFLNYKMRYLLINLSWSIIKLFQIKVLTTETGKNSKMDADLEDILLTARPLPIFAPRFLCKQISENAQSQCLIPSSEIMICLDLFWQPCPHSPSLLCS